MTNTQKNAFIDYDVEGKKLRSPMEEWKPHLVQTDKTFEWWYLTSLLYDAAGNPYFLFWCEFHFAGKYYVNVIPNLTEKMKPGQSAFQGVLGFTDYSNEYHFGSGEMTIMNDEDVYDLTSNSKIYISENRQSKWSYDGKNSHLSLKTEHLDAELNMSNADYIMYAKDKYNVEGFMQEGAEDDFSFYWSLPRLPITGTISFEDKNGEKKELYVTGQGWIDRQWGDFKTNSWEWSSLRFNNGARVNLYNFANGYQVGTYQKADGSTEWFDNFVVKQNGYYKTPGRNIWFSWGWTYELPIEIEGSKKYTVVPYSKIDTSENAANSFFEGPGKLYKDETGEIVGVSINESMDVRIMGNGPYGENQH